MLVWIDQDCCTGAGLCVDRCPDLFVVLEDGIGYVHDGEAVLTDPNALSLVVPARYERDAIDAAEHCPGECIYLDVESSDHPDAPDPDDDSDIHDAEIVVDSS
jgi:ferredoxin